MRGFFARVAVALVVLAGVVGVAAPEASATPSVCGWLTVTVDNESHGAPIDHCEPPCGGVWVDVGHYEHDLIVAEVIVDGWLCVRGV